MAITSITASFDGNQLTSISGLSILATDPYKAPKRTLSSFLLARTNKMRTTSAFYTQKSVSIRIAIQTPSRGVTEQSFDALMKIVQGQTKELILSQAGGVRKYFCTLASVDMVRAGGSYMEFTLVFNCDDNFGYDTGYTTALSLSGITAATRGDAVPFDGSAPWQAPLITIFYTALTGGTSKSVVIGNLATGQQITVTRTWAAGDRLEIDTYNRTVKVNGTEVAFTGAFPEFAPALGNWTYSDGLTTRTFNATITYYKRYI